MIGKNVILPILTAGAIALGGVSCEPGESSKPSGLSGDIEEMYNNGYRTVYMATPDRGGKTRFWSYSYHKDKPNEIVQTRIYSNDQKYYSDVEKQMDFELANDIEMSNADTEGFFKRNNKAWEKAFPQEYNANQLAQEFFTPDSGTFLSHRKQEGLSLDTSSVAKSAYSKVAVNDSLGNDSLVYKGVKLLVPDSLRKDSVKLDSMRFYKLMSDSLMTRMDSVARDSLRRQKINLDSLLKVRCDSFFNARKKSPVKLVNDSLLNPRGHKAVFDTIGNAVRTIR